MRLKLAFYREKSAIMLAYYMTQTDVTSIEHIDILSIGIGKYTQNQLGKQVYYPDFRISAHL